MEPGKMLDIDLNCSPDLESPVLSPQDAGISAQVNHEVQPIGGQMEIPKEPLLPAVLGATSRTPLKKKRGCPMSQEVPAGWVVDQHIRPLGKSAGIRDKYYIEPGTGKKFRSMVAVRRHLGVADSKPCQK